MGLSPSARTNRPMVSGASYISSPLPSFAPQHGQPVQKASEALRPTLVMAQTHPPITSLNRNKRNMLGSAPGSQSRISTRAANIDLTLIALAPKVRSPPRPCAGPHPARIRLFKSAEAGRLTPQRPSVIQNGTFRKNATRPNNARLPYSRSPAPQIDISSI